VTWDAWLFTVLGLALALTPIALIALCAARFGSIAAWACGVALYGLPLLIGFAVMGASTSEYLGPISDSVVAVFIAALVLQLGTSLALRFFKRKAPAR